MIVLAVAGFVACSSGVDTPDVTSDLGSSGTAKCDPDDFNSLTQTRAATLDTAASDTICPQQDHDYWKITGIGGTKQLLNVNLEYDKLSDIELQADVWGPRGRCMPNALTECTTSTQCSGDTTYCDTTRGGCRSATAAVCYDNTNCDTGEQCYGTTTAVELLGQVYIDKSSAFQHKLNANYPAFVTGDYTIIVYDHAEREADATATYALTVTTEIDVDANEPNEQQNQATPMTSGASLEGAMSYVGDVDWFKLEPLAGSPTIIKVDLQYLSSSTIEPTWTIFQGDGQYDGPSLETVGSGASAKIQQTAAVVNLGTGPIYIRIQNSGTEVNTTDRYTLTVELTQDPDEGNNRNDVVTQATATGPNDYSKTGHIVATNDFDWYQLNRTPSTNNTLINIVATASASAPYSLVVQYWTETTTTCNSAGTNTCPQGNPCAPTDHCLELLVQRPDPDDEYGDPQVGGRSPNHLETQLPMFSDTAFVRIANNPSTTLAVAGYDNIAGGSPYSLTLTYLTEPDSGDAGVPDNEFVGRPAENDAEMEDFGPNYRLSSATVNTTTGALSAIVSGIISYDGDQDFFKITPDIALGAFNGGGLHIHVDYHASAVDLRVTAEWNDNSVGAAPTQDDFCGDDGQCAEEATCTTERATCEEVAIDIDVPSSTQCSYTDANNTNPISVWVNDVGSNDWDSTAYTVTVSYVPGCPGEPQCSTDVCTP